MDDPTDVVAATEESANIDKDDALFSIRWLCPLQK